MTQVIAAKRANMAQSTLGELEMEGQGSTFTAQLAEIYGVNSTWLATGKGEMLGKDMDGLDVRHVKAVVLAEEPESEDLNDAIKLLTLFSQATASGRSFILAAAANAEKSAGRKRNSGTRD